MNLKTERFSPRKERGFFARAQQRHSSFWTIFLENLGSPGVQLAVVVKKSAMKKATERNALRRKVRAFMDRSLKTTPSVGRKAVIVWRKKEQPSKKDLEKMYEAIRSETR